MTGIVFVIFAAALFVVTASARTGWRSQVCHGFERHLVAPGVQADPELNARLNQLVKRWGTAAAVLAALPLPALAIHGIERDLPIWAAAVLALHGLIMTCAAQYPFEKIKQLADAKFQKTIL